MNSNGAARTARTPGASPTALGVVTVAVLTLLAVVAAACASSEPSPVATAPVAPEPPPAEPAPAPEPPATPEPPAATTAASGSNDLPAVTVVDVVSGESLVLSSLAPANRPILVWFWAPH